MCFREFAYNDMRLLVSRTRGTQRIARGSLLLLGSRRYVGKYAVESVAEKLESAAEYGAEHVSWPLLPKLGDA